MCPGCGHRKHESFDPDGPEYIARTAVCRACEARDEVMAAFRDDEHADRNGVFFVVEQGEPDPAETRSAVEAWASKLESTAGSGRGGFDAGMLD